MLFRSYDNNRHFKYVLLNYGFMLKRFDLKFAKSEVGLDEKNPVFIDHHSDERGICTVIC